MSKWDIKEEYEKVFGKIIHENLFSSDDEEYKNLRQEIFDSKIEFCNPFNKLPFDEGDSYYDKRKTDTQSLKKSLQPKLIDDGKCLDSPSGRILLNKTIESLIFHRNSMLSKSASAVESYISKKDVVTFYYINESGLCSAKGYFDNKTRGFYICKASKISKFQALRFNSATTKDIRNKFIQNHCKQINGYFQVLEDTLVESANIAACIVLGRISSSRRWIDQNGNPFSVK